MQVDNGWNNAEWQCQRDGRKPHSTAPSIWLVIVPFSRNLFGSEGRAVVFRLWQLAGEVVCEVTAPKLCRGTHQHCLAKSHTQPECRDLL